MSLQKMCEIDKKTVSALAVGLATFMTLSAMMGTVVKADEVADYSQSVGVQEVFEETNDMNIIVLNDIKAPNKMFKGWNTKPDGSGTFYEAGSELNIERNITIYPVWEEIAFNVSADSGNYDITSGGEVRTMLISYKNVGVDGILLDTDSLINKVTTNEGLNVTVEKAGIETDTDLEAEGDYIYPLFKDINSIVNILVKYEIHAIDKDGSIVGTSTVNIPIQARPSLNYFDERTEETALHVMVDETNNSYVLNEAYEMYEE